MIRVNVRCCCQPQKILGTLEVPHAANGQVWRSRFQEAFFAAMVREELPKLVPTGSIPMDATTSIKTKIIKLKMFHGDGAYDEEVAVYSEERPLEFWRQFYGFKEGDAV